MNRYGEYLFDAVFPELKENFDNLTEEDVECCCEYKIFQRGLDYFDDGLVEQVSCNVSNDTISATVLGTKRYTVEFFMNENEVQGDCSCPYNGVCKHMVAVLLYIAENEISTIKTINTTEVSDIPSSGLIKKHLKSLSKDELVDLVMRFAPKGFITQVKNSYSGGSETIALFTKVEKKIKIFFSDAELLFSPSDFEDSLTKELDKLRGLEDKLVKEIGELIIFIIYNVEDAFNEGYLYVDNYYEDDFFESEAFCAFVINYIEKLSFNQKTKYLLLLDESLNSMSYSTFEDISRSYIKFFRDDEYKELKEFILKSTGSVPASFISRLYNYLEPGLSIPEKEKVLLKLKTHGSIYVITLSEMLIQQERYNEAYKTLKNYLGSRDGFVEDRVMELYLDLTKKLSYNLNEPAKDAISRCPNTAMLFKIKDIINGSIKEYENILKSKNPIELLAFYEKEKRFQNALSLIKEIEGIWEPTLFDFFKRNKKSIPSEAEQYFMSRIDENLRNTGNSYYERIAETIRQVKYINPSLATELVANIRINYKRRTNLIAMLKRF